MDDLISREAAIDAVWKIDAEIRPSAIDAIIKMLKGLPAAQPQRKPGKWVGYNADNPVWLRNDGAPIFLVCSECHGTVINNGSANWNYCPSCGARMDGGEQDG